MKNSLSFLSALLLIFLASCNNPCDNVLCGDQGYCDDGTCICEDGYEGLACESKTIDKFIGVYTSTDFGCDGFILGSTTLVFAEGYGHKDLVMYDIEEPEIVVNIIYEDFNLAIAPYAIDDAILTANGTLNEDGTLSLFFQITEDSMTSYCHGTFRK